MSTPVAAKIQPWKVHWPPENQATVCNTKVDYGIKQGDVVILDGSGFMLKPFDAYSKPTLTKIADLVVKPSQ